jgi:hypothetical protein
MEGMDETFLEGLEIRAATAMDGRARREDAKIPI